MSTRSSLILFGIIVLAAGSFIRLWRLNDRPMHPDEAVHADKFGKLLQEDVYRYDPYEFHGPVLNYATLLSAGLRGETTYSQVTAATLRGVPAVIGIALLLTPLLFRKGLTGRTVLFGILLLAFSPAFVYYSRYYIQETLLVTFTAAFLGCAWRYGQTHKVGWLIAAGAALGLMHAAKETFVLSLLAAGAAMLVCRPGGLRLRKLNIVHLLAGLAAAIVVSVLFFSSFGTNWPGVPDSLTTYTAWLHRAGGNSPHIHPWHFYLDRLTWNEFTESVTWNEDGIVVLAAFGLFFAFSRRNRIANQPGLVRFWAVYTLSLTVIYSVIPYKTPWCLLNFLYGMAILAAFALDRLLRTAEARWQKLTVWLLVGTFVIASPFVQSWLLNFRYAASPSNPYVYAHTTSDIEPMIEAVERTAAASPQGKHIPIQIIAAGADYWPLPWYLRDYPNVGYWSQVEPAVARAPLILAGEPHEKALLQTLYTVPEPGQRHLYLPLYDRPLYLRPGVEWRGYIRKDLADCVQAAQMPAPTPQAQPQETWMNKPDKQQIEYLKFSHEAMNTVFEVFIQDDRGAYAGRAARTAFNEVDRLEQQLSRFLPNSDISRLNHAIPGETVILNEDTFKCLVLAEKAYEMTNGAFDVTLGDAIETWKNSRSVPPSEIPDRGRLTINEEVFAVTIPDGGVNIDLGGIGKGYAVDVIARVLAEWGIQTALIHGGSSSVRALTAPRERSGWPVTLTHPATGLRLASLNLAHEVLSGSGLQQGAHIIDPASGKPVTERTAAWFRCPDSAALADALSTAAMIMPVEAMQQVADGNPDFAFLIIPAANPSEILKIGSWPAE